MNGDTEKQLIKDVEFIRGKMVMVCEEIKNAREDRLNLFNRMRKAEVKIGKNETKIEGMGKTVMKISGFVSSLVVAIIYGIIYAIKLFLGLNR